MRKLSFATAMALTALLAAQPAFAQYGMDKKGPKNAGTPIYKVKRAIVIRATPSPQAPQVRSFSPGDMVYPAGQKNGIWREVGDENGNRGWVSSAMIGRG